MGNQKFLATCESGGVLLTREFECISPDEARQIVWREGLDWFDAGRKDRDFADIAPVKACRQLVREGLFDFDDTIRVGNCATWELWQYPTLGE